MEGQEDLDPKYITVEVEVKIETTVKEIIRIGIGQIIDHIVQTENNSGKTEVDADLSKVVGEIISEKIQEVMADKIAEENTETTIIVMIAMIEAGIGLEKSHFPVVMTVIELGVQAIVD